MMRHPGRLDRLIADANHALRTVAARADAPSEPSPGASEADVVMDNAARRHAAGLMRINHTGEVCAQALYLGQAAVARNAGTEMQLRAAAREEADHLAWCEGRLDDLDARPSLFNPLWYAGAYAIGAAAGLVGDRVSLGFIVETERQVEAHLEDHLRQLPAEDGRSRAIVSRMQADEARHAEHALEAGATELPAPVKRLMRTAADLMKAIAYRL
jgi:ubiquinone biosynthesis monooxygenase Coq7